MNVAEREHPWKTRKLVVRVCNVTSTRTAQNNSATLAPVFCARPSRPMESGALDLEMDKRAALFLWLLPAADGMPADAACSTSHPHLSKRNGFFPMWTTNPPCRGELDPFSTSSAGYAENVGARFAAESTSADGPHPRGQLQRYFKSCHFYKHFGSCRYGSYCNYHHAERPRQIIHRRSDAWSSRSYEDYGR